MSLIKKVRTEEILDEESIMKQVVEEHDPAMLITASGRLKRWVKLPYEPVYAQKTCCSKTVLPEQTANLNFIHGLDKYEEKLFDNLAVRARAIKNWRFLKNQVILRIVAFRVQTWNLDEQYEKFLRSPRELRRTE